MDSVGRAALEGAALGALAGGVGAAVGAAGLSGAAAFAVSEGADFIGGFLYDIGVNGLSREEALINGLMGIGFGGAIGLLGRGISRAARNVNLPLPRQLRRQCASFSADTLIATPDGDKPISEIEVGDVILAYSEATEEVDIYHVSATHTQRHDTTLDGETLHTTDEHPFYVIRDDQEQWVQAKHLHIGDRVVSALGETGIVEDIVIVDQPQTMYNLTVSLVATYLVGDGQWVVHNTNACVVFGAGGDFSEYTNDILSFIAPASQIAAVMRRFPDRGIISVDIGAGGISDYLGNLSSRPITTQMASHLKVDLGIGDANLNNFLEVRADYARLPLASGITDTAIAFYPNPMSFKALNVGAAHVLAPGGKFYIFADVELGSLIDNSLWSNHTLSSLYMPSIREGQNPLGLRNFHTNQYTRVHASLMSILELSRR